MNRYALFLFCFLFIVPARAELTLQGLAYQCKGMEPMPDNPVVGKLTCASYIAGFLDAMILHDTILTRDKAQKNNQLCPPEGAAKTAQLMQVVIKYSEQVPGQQHSSARSVLYAIILNLYKCSN